MMARKLIEASEDHNRCTVPIHVASRNLLVLAEADLILSDPMTKIASPESLGESKSMINPQDLISQLRGTNRDLYEILRHVESLNDRSQPKSNDKKTRQDIIVAMALEEMVRLASISDDLGDVLLADEIDFLLKKAHRPSHSSS